MKLLLLDRPLDESIVRQREVEFFGPWAEPIHSPADLSEPGFRPYPDPQTVFAVSRKATSVADGILSLLSEIMPALTGVHRTRRFWRAYLGYYTVILTGWIEDIKHRQASLPQKDYIIGLPAGGREDGQVPYSWREAWRYMQFEDSFKWQLMSLCLRNYYQRQERVAYRRMPLTRTTKSGEEFYAKLLQSNYKRIARKAGSVLFGRSRSLNRLRVRDDGICSLVWDRYQLEDFDFRKLGAAFLPEGYCGMAHPGPALQIDPGKRERLKGSLPDPYGEIISMTLPVSDLEGLPSSVRLIENRDLVLCRGIQRVYTHGQAFAEDGARRTLFALLADEKTVVSVQHGIGHAYYAHAGLFVDKTIADEHVSWGQGYCQGNALPSIYLGLLKRKAVRTNANRKKKWDVLFVVLEEDRYAKWIYSPLFPDLAHDYFQREKALFDYFCREKNSAVKVYPVSHGWGQFDWIRKEYPRTQVLTAGKSVHYALRSRIVIVDYLGSNFLEILAMNIPFMACWNRQWFRGNERFEHCMDKLRDAGIFHEDPASLIRAYAAKIGPDVLSWWRDKNRQEAVRQMGDDFAMTSDSFREEWRSEFSRQPQRKSFS